MSNDEILEGNKVIAEFMNFEGYEEKGHVNPFGEYHTSFDWLMPVIVKINFTGKFRVRIFFDANGTNAIYNCYIDKVTWVGNFLNDDRICGRSDIEKPMLVIWKTVVEFLKWKKLND